MFLTPIDFSGKYELHKGMYDTSKLQVYINKYEAQYLKSLLGINLFNQFISDLDTITFVPKSPNFLKIFNPFSEDINYNILDSDGILEMLKGFIYFEYSKDNFMQQTTFGGVQQKSENSVVLNSLQTLIYNRYNEAIKTYHAIQDFILLNPNIDTGQVVEFTKSNVPSPYQYPTFGQIWTAFPVLLNKGVKLWDVTGIPGNGYPVGLNSNILCTGGTGSGMRVTFTANGLGVPTINTIVCTEIGSGYTIGDVVTIEGSTLQSRQLVITAVFNEGIVGTGLKVQCRNVNFGGVNATTLVNSGANNYSVGIFDLVGGSGTGAKVKILSVDNLGSVSAYSIYYEGQGYNATETLQVLNPLTVGPLFTIQISAVYSVQFIKEITILETGKNYLVGQQMGIPDNFGTFFNLQGSNALGGVSSFQWITLNYVGKGEFDLFRGKQKGTAYWI